jgi:hypothetical protein
MAIAHVCIQCGWDLARVRPTLEPRYRLPLVICPRCARACVRREHPLRSGWWRLVRVDAALRVLTLQVLCIGLVGALSTAATLGVMTGAYQRLAGRDAEFLEWLCFWVFAVFSPLTGSWLTAAFSHLRRSAVWLGWYAFMSLPLLTMLVMGAWFGDLPVEAPGQEHITASWSVFKLGLISFFAPGMVIAAAMMACATAGIPLGKILLQLHAKQRGAVWRWRRRRRKLARAAL